MRAGLIVLALWLAGLGAAAQFGKISVLYEVLALRYAGHGVVALGLAVSVVGLVGLVFGTTAGLIVMRVGPRRAILWALVLGAAVSVGQAGLPPYPLMMALRVLEGVSHLAIVVVGPVVIAGAASVAWQGAAMTLWSTFFGLTYALLAVLAPPLLAFGGAGALFLAHGGWMLACACLLTLLLPRDVGAGARTHAGGRGEGLVAQHLAIYASPRVAAPALGFVFYTAIYVAILTLLPPLLPQGWRGPVAAGMPIVSILVSLTLGVWLLPRLGPVRVVQVGFGAGALAVVGFGAGLGLPWAMAAGAMGLAAAMGLAQGASFAAIPALNEAPADRARAAGAIAQMGNLGTTTGTPLLALMVAGMGPVGIVAFTLPLCLCGIATHGWLSRRRALS